MPSNPRNGRPYRRLCAAQKALRLPCWWCGHNIRYDISGPDAGKHPDAFTLDHEIPLSLGGSLLDPGNARSAHRRCNSARGNRIGPAKLKTSRRW